MEDEELLSIIKYTDLIDAQHVESYIRTFLDTANWTDKNRSEEVNLFLMMALMK